MAINRGFIRQAPLQRKGNSTVALGQQQLKNCSVLHFRMVDLKNTSQQEEPSI